MPNPAFDRVIIIVMENEFSGYVMQNPFMAKLASQGIVLTNSFGVMHPSQTNYIASIAGELCNVTTDDAPITPLLTQRTIVDLIERTPSLDWRAYMESYGPPQQPVRSFPYVQRHDPFSSFQGIAGNSVRLAKIVDLAQFWADVAGGTLPQYSWITPNMWNDGHYQYGTQNTPNPRAPELVDSLACWLQYVFGVLRFPGPDSRLPKGTLVVVTFDESDFEAAYEPTSDSYQGANQIYTVLLGDMIAPGTQDGAYNHYSLLKTVEQNWGLGSLLKNDASANWFRFLWGEQFSWSTPRSVDAGCAGGLAAAQFGEHALVVYQNEGGSLLWRTYDQQAGWSAEAEVGPTASGACALGTSGGQAILVYRAPGSLDLLTVTYDDSAKWSSTPVPVGAQAAGSIALCSFTPLPNAFAVGEPEGAAPQSDLMLVYADPAQALHSTIYRGGAWGAPSPVGYSTDGTIALAALGGSVYLVYKVVGSASMNAVLYNAAVFNQVSPGPGSPNTTALNAWSASSYRVGEYRAAKSMITPGEPEPVESHYQTTGALGMASLDGEIRLVYPTMTSAVGIQALQATVFSLSGVMASEVPTVSGTASSNAITNGSYSNSYGTLAEVGWSVETPIATASSVGATNLAVSGAGSGLVLVYSEHGSGTLRYAAGAFVGSVGP